MNVKMSDLTLASDDHWHELVDSRDWVGKDIYFLPQWYRTWEESGYGQAHCLYGKIRDLEFLYPFLLNPIKGYDLPSTFYDVETAYGYGGVLVTRAPSAKEKKLFNQTVDDWMKDRQVVAEFIRLLPDLNSIRVREADYLPVRIDLFTDLDNLTKEAAWKGLLSAKTRNIVRKAEKNHLRFSVSDNLAEFFPSFISIYLETAERIKMGQFYYFNEAYYRSLAANAGERVLLANVMHNDEVMASSVWLLYNNILHYYLGATKNKYKNLGSSDAYLWGMLAYALENGIAVKIHWGGGNSLDPRDGLYRFKAKFSNRSEQVFIGKNVLNRDIYDSLCRQWEAKYPELISKHGKKLLKYREKDL